MTSETETKPVRKTKAEEQPSLPDIEQIMVQDWAILQQAQKAHKSAAQAVADVQGRIAHLTDQLESAKADLTTKQAAEAKARVGLRETMAAVIATATEYGSALE